MIKKILSLFLALTCLFSPVANASGTPKIAPPRPSKTGCKSTSYSYLKRIAIQKAFLIGLLCTTGSNVYIKLYPGPKTESSNFTVIRIDSTNIEVKNCLDHSAQINALLYFLINKKDVVDFEYDPHTTGFLTSCVKINNYYLTQKVIQDIGEKILELICEKKKISYRSNIERVFINLTQDPSFMQEVTKIFNDILYTSPQATENAINFYTFPSSSTKKLEPVQNFNHVSYIKKCPEESSRLELCYIKAFFVSMLSLAGAEITISHYGKSLNYSFEFIDAFNLRKINDTSTYQKNGIHPKYITYLIKLIDTTLPPEKLKIETMGTNFNMPIKVTICGSIVLNEIDIFNLGQRFHNIAYDIMQEYCEDKAYFNLSDLNKIEDLNQKFKQEFKKYTGVDLPDLK